ncbi:MAG: cobyric acid synthase [Mycobacteriaceae bacterium]
MTGTSALSGAILIAGTTSDAGKSVVVAGICRLLARQGIRVAPFKAQNMSNNSVVTLDGGEIGRAQALQAQACGLAPSVRFNPVLLKPGSDRSSQLVIRGAAVGMVTAKNYFTHKVKLKSIVFEELSNLRNDFDVVICEGAGSPAEINLRDNDIANMGLAVGAQLPTLIVGDIDRGGVLAHLFGTLAVLDKQDQQLISGFIVNKFRGDASLLEPGLTQLYSLTGRKTLGVLPFNDDLWIDAEDSLGSAVDTPVGRPQPALGSQWLRVAAIRLPRVSNATDIEALAAEPGVVVQWVSDPSRLVDADLVVLPGSKATVSDLQWLRAKGLAETLVRRAEQGGPILGVCGGYQMLCRRIIDNVEAEGADVAGLGIFDTDIVFEPEKILAQVTGHYRGGVIAGYRIHHGRVVRNNEIAFIRDENGVGEGSVRGSVFGTHWHGLLHNDEFRRVWLSQVAELARRRGFTVSPVTSVSKIREQQLDLLADLIEENLDVQQLKKIIKQGPSGDLPTVLSGLG